MSHYKSAIYDPPEEGMPLLAVIVDGTGGNVVAVQPVESVEQGEKYLQQRLAGLEQHEAEHQSMTE